MLKSMEGGAKQPSGPGYQAIFVQDGPGARLSLILSVFSLIAAIVAVVVVIATFSGVNNKTTETVATTAAPAVTTGVQTVNGQSAGSQTWYFGYPDDYKPYSFTDGTNLRGLSVKLVDAVCKEAGVSCRHLLIKSQFCFDRTRANGEALFGDWVDACVGWFKTIERVNVHSAFAPLYNRVTSRLLTKDPSKKLSDLAGLKLGIIKGDHADDLCLRQKNVVVRDVTEFSTVGEAIQKLEANEIEVLFLAKYNEEIVDNPTQYKSIEGGDTLYCAISGSGLLTKKGSQVETWFPSALERIRDTGEMEALCKQSISEFGSQSDCVLNKIN